MCRRFEKKWDRVDSNVIGKLNTPILAVVRTSLVYLALVVFGGCDYLDTFLCRAITLSLRPNDKSGFRMGEEGECISCRVCYLSLVIASSPSAYRRSFDLCVIFSISLHCVLILLLHTSYEVRNRHMHRFCCKALRQALIRWNDVAGAL